MEHGPATAGEVRRGNIGKGSLQNSSVLLHLNNDLMHPGDVLLHPNNVLSHLNNVLVHPTTILCIGVILLFDHVT